jgi:hypothetical protein
MLRIRPAMEAAEGVRSTATNTDVPEFGFSDARLIVHFIASGDRFAGRLWGSITGLMFPPESRAMEARLSYVLRRCSHEVILTPPAALTDGKLHHRASEFDFRVGSTRSRGEAEQRRAEIRSPGA